MLKNLKSFAVKIIAMFIVNAAKIEMIRRIGVIIISMNPGLKKKLILIVKSKLSPEGDVAVSSKNCMSPAANLLYIKIKNDWRVKRGEF